MLVEGLTILRSFDNVIIAANGSVADMFDHGPEGIRRARERADALNHSAASHKPY